LPYFVTYAVSIGELSIKKVKGLRIAAAAGLALTVTATPLLGGTHSANAARRQAASGTVGFLFSDFTTSARWEFDKSYYEAALKALDPNVSVSIKDATNDQTQQANQARSLLTTGAKVLIDVPVDSAQAAAIVRLAHANSPKVPVIAYDRLIQGAPVDAYTTFDGFSVGAQQAKYLIAHVKKGGSIVSIAGASTDNNAILFHAGAMSVIQPLVKQGVYKLVYDKYTPKWDNNTGQAEMAAALTQNKNKVDGVLVANDGLAGGVIAALKAQGLAGKIPVTGQDATIAGFQQILLGNQSMTIYKPLKLLASAAAKVTDAFLNHKMYTFPTTTDNGAGKIPTVLLPVTTVTKANIKSTVIKDGFIKRSDICVAQTEAACKALGI